MSALAVLDLSRLVRAVLAIVATLLLALALAGSFVVAALGAIVPTVSPFGPSGPGSPAAGEIPADYLAMMRRASDASCGVPWEILAAIAKIESDFTPTAVGPYLPQFAGTEDEHALGMMQFLPSTYRLFIPRVDAATGKGLGMAGIWDPESAIHAAAFYLCDSGAAVGDLRSAIFAYNRADWYVDKVLAQAAAYSLGGGGGSGGAGLGADAVALARQYLGWPYAWGGASPATSFDCSGLVQWVYGQLGVALPRTAQAQYDATDRVAESDLRPGDLVFFAQTYPDPAEWITHVGIYVGSGIMINAPQEGDVIKEVPAFDGFWGAHYAGAGRVRP
jgi:cell wall-associated NlpC family hydrolase